MFLFVCRVRIVSSVQDFSYLYLSFRFLFYLLLLLLFFFSFSMSSGQSFTFETALKKLQKTVEAFDSFGGGLPSPKELEEMIGLASLCRETVERRGYFSRNEELDDIPTSSLMLLLFPYYEAILRSKLPPPAKPAAEGIPARLAELETVQRGLRIFIKSLADLSILAEEECAGTLRHLDDRMKRAISGDFSEKTTPEEAMLIRNEKVGLYRLKKQAAAAVQAAEAKLSRQKVEGEYEDEEDARNYSLSALRLAGLVAVDELGGVVREATMLLEVARLQASGTYEETLRREEAALAERRKHAQKPFTITASDLGLREKAMKQVFNPKTMAVLSPDDPVVMATDDALEGLDNGKQQEEEHNSSDDDSDKETDESLAKKRHWDEWKDENPRGWGNTIGMG